MVKKTEKKILYANRVNLNGLYSSKPIELTYDSELKSWWSKDGWVGVDKIGLDKNKGYVVFSSFDENEVVCWTNGVRSWMSILREWCNYG